MKFETAPSLPISSGPIFRPRRFCSKECAASRTSGPFSEASEITPGLSSFALDPTKLQGDLDLTPAEGFVLSRVDGATSPWEIAQLSPLGEEETLRCVYALLAAGILETKSAAETFRRVARQRSRRSSPRRPCGFSSRCVRSRDASPDSTLYEILEVAPSAVPEAIKAAYFRLAKQLHPDHRTGLKLEDDGGVLDELYLRVKGAYEVLSSETERRRYDFGLSQKAGREARAQASTAANPAPKGEAPPPSPAADAGSKSTFTTSQTARLHFRNGERYFEEGRFHEAIEELRAAVRQDPMKAEYYRALGRALSKNPKWRRQAEDAFAKAIEINRFDADAYVELGEIYHQGGLEKRARKMFEEALAVDPDNVRRPRKARLGKARQLHSGEAERDAEASAAGIERELSPRPNTRPASRGRA